MSSVPPELESTVRLLDLSFPDGVNERQYRLLLAVLRTRMSYRQLAKAVSAWSGRDYYTVLHDVYGVEDVEDLLELVIHMAKHGLVDWFDEPE